MMPTSEEERLHAQTRNVLEFIANKPAGAWSRMVGVAAASQLSAFQGAASALLTQNDDHRQKIEGATVVCAASQSTLAEVLIAQETAQNWAENLLTQTSAARDHLQQAALHERRCQRDELEVLRLLQVAQMAVLPSARE
jgi:hypothetical protein